MFWMWKRWKLCEFCNGNRRSFLSRNKRTCLKYNIEIEEKELTPDQIDKENKRDGIYLIGLLYKQFFQDNFGETEEGKIIGLSYFKQQDIQTKLSKSFNLDMALNKRTALLKEASLSRIYIARIFRRIGAFLFLMKMVVQTGLKKKE